MKPCLEPRCPELVKRGRCQEHTRRYDQAIRRQGRQVYATKRWKVLRKRKLYLDSLCERCGEVASDVHHRHGVANDAWSLEGLESLCHGCHSAETRREQLERSA